MELATPIGRVLAAAVLTVAVAALVLANAATAASGKAMPLVSTAKNADLGKTVLVNRKGLTLYSLSVEQRGRFICTDRFCLSLWTPLLVPKGTTPTGSPHLGTVRRPDGRTQVSYRGRPVYTFTQDRKPGDVKGNGFKDVGVWRPAFPGSTVSAAPPATNPYPGYPGYGG